VDIWADVEDMVGSAQRESSLAMGFRRTTMSVDQIVPNSVPFQQGLSPRTHA
jgi:hypothetical protein